MKKINITKLVIKIKSRLPSQLFKKSGTALLMTVMILNSIIIVSLAAAKLIVSGVKDGGIQVKSTKAYFIAEAGSERILYEYRKGSTACYNTPSSCHFSAALPAGGSYQVDWISGTNFHGSFMVMASVGTFAGVERTDELDFNY